MGDFGLYDEFTQGLLDTLEKLKLYKSDRSIFDMAANMFGQPADLFVSPQALKAFQKLSDDK